MNEIIEEKLKLLPSRPGVYKMFNAAGEVIYVGKAVSLKNRVRSYFQASKNHTPKVAAMVSHVVDFETIQTNNETEALTLESNLIKHFKPRYNILLKDDKHFPYVRINMKMDYPRIEVVRRIKKDGARYLGPYLSSSALYEALNVVREHYPVRHCKKDISAAIARRERPCLMYHVNKCCAPCTGNLSREEYHAILEEVCDFLQGHTEPVIRDLTARMQQASDEMRFEQAALLRDRIMAIRALGEKQIVINTKDVDQDVFALCTREGETLVFALFVRAGKVVGTNANRMQNAHADTPEEILSAFLAQYYLEAMQVPPEVLLYQNADGMEHLAEWLTEKQGRKVELLCPQRGEKRRLTELAYQNGCDLLEKEHILRQRAFARGEGALAALSAALGLSSLPMRMECFDNSHIQGRDTVSSMVVFENGQPARKAYRRFRITLPANGDDLTAMREALTRRFSRLDDEKFAQLPDLLVIDGGKTQLKIACEVLEEKNLSHIPVIALAEKHEHIYLPDMDEPIILERNDPALHLLERLRDEAHRFAITYHRSLRQKNALMSTLDKIPGVGPKRKRALFDAFITFDAIKGADMEALLAVVDKRTAQSVYDYFHTENE